MRNRFEVPLSAGIAQCAKLPAEQRLARAIGLRLSMDELAYYELVGLQLNAGDVLWPVRRELARDLATRDPDNRSVMMTPEEFARWELLPDQLTVFRGCYWNNQDGLAWSVDVRDAVRFPAMPRYRRESSPLLVTGRVARARCVLKLNDGRVDIFSADVQAGEPVQLPPRNH